MYVVEGMWIFLSQGEFFLFDLDVDNIKIVEEIIKWIQENFYFFCDLGLLNIMMEYYLKMCFFICLQILSGIYEV